MSRDDEDEYYEFQYSVTCVHETDGAIKVTYHHPKKGLQELWCPKAVIHDDSPVFEKGDEGKLFVFNSFADDKEWEKL